MLKVQHALWWTVGGMVLLSFPLAFLDKAFAPSSGSSQSAKKEYEKFGTQCLSGVDGSHRAFKSEVRAMLRDPSSFKHLGTRVTVADRFGNHRMTMTYSAKNGFGGTNVEIATGEFNRDTCRHRLSTAQ